MYIYLSILFQYTIMRHAGLAEIHEEKQEEAARRRLERKKTRKINRAITRRRDISTRANLLRLHQKAARANRLYKAAKRAAKNR